MSALHLKYRPKTLDEVVGNTEAVTSLRALLSRDRKKIPHAFLLTGPSGTGKTTLGRIIKEALGCSDFDYKEVDSADFRGVDTIREIRQAMQLGPMNGPCRIWLLDECHQLTKDAQSALLKALEDTPEWVYFILCTTDPQKLLPTIKTRCTTYSTTPLSDKEIIRLLRGVLAKEGKKAPKEVLFKIAEQAKGSTRAALVALDKIIDLPKESMEQALENWEETEAEAIDLCRALIKKSSWKKVSQILKNLKSEDPEKVRRLVLSYASTVLLNSGDPTAWIILESFNEPLYNTGFPGLVKAAFDAVVEATGGPNLRGG